LPLLAGQSSHNQPPGMPLACRFFRRLNGRYVPEAEVNPGVLKGSYRES